MSNNPFASAMTGQYRHHRDPPPPPSASSTTSTNKNRPPRPGHESKPAPAPPLYEEAAGRNRAARDYPREKSSSTTERTSERPRRSSNSDRPRRHHSDSERHRKVYERRHRSSHKSSRNKSPKKKTIEPHNSKGLDTIDKLDVSAFFGGRFHHDGPFDACTPHRNKDSKAAPVMAFPADGPNTSMKALPKEVQKSSHLHMAFGSGPDQNEIVGSVGSNGNLAVPKTNRAPVDPLSSINIPRQNPSILAFDVHAKAEPVHGPSTAGLGSTTFLDGAPAPKTDDSLTVPSNNLGRKKSLVHRLRKNSGSEATSARTSHDNSGEYARTFADEDAQGSSFLRRVKSLKVGRKS